MALADLNVLGAFNQARDLSMREGTNNLQKVGMLQSILARQQQQQMAQQEAQEQAQMRGVVQQAGGDPKIAIQKLIATGHPKAIELATKMQAMLPKPAEPYTLAPGGQRRGPNNELLAEAPMKPAADKGTWSDPYNMSGAMVQKNSLTGEIRTAVSRQSPGVTVNMPASSDTVQGADGKFYKFRIGKDGRPETIPFQTASGEPLSPPESAAKGKSREELAAEAQTLGSVRSRIGKMASLIQGGGMAGGVVGPLGMASRIGETAVGAVNAGAATPALDYQNEMRLLLSDVRKMVEKDPNLSKDEREAMYETLGGGIMQTPGSAIRTLNNIVNHVESKQRSGAGRSAGLAAQVKAAGWAYEPNKYEYRVTDGKVQRKAK